MGVAHSYCYELFMNGSPPCSPPISLATSWVASYTLTLMFVLVHFVTAGLFTTSSLPPKNVKFIFPLSGVFMISDQQLII